MIIESLERKINWWFLTTKENIKTYFESNLKRKYHKNSDDLNKLYIKRPYKLACPVLRLSYWINSTDKMVQSVDGLILSAVGKSGVQSRLDRSHVTERSPEDVNWSHTEGNFYFEHHWLLKMMTTFNSVLVCFINR